MRRVAVVFAALLVSCICERLPEVDAEVEDSGLEVTCQCEEPWRCEWPESGVVVFLGDCIFCTQDDGGTYVCMNQPSVP